MFHQPKRKIDVDLCAFQATRDIYENGVEKRYGERPVRSPESNTIIRQAVADLGAYCAPGRMQQFIESDRVEFVRVGHSLVAFKQMFKGLKGEPV